MAHKTLFPLIILGITMLIGCSNHVPLRGKVTYSDDGTPLEAGMVCFVSPNGFLSRGDIKNDGMYIVGTNKSNDGLPPGDYSVYIIQTEQNIQQPMRGSDGQDTFVDVTVERIDRKYASPRTSGITATVDRTTKTFDFQVERYKPNPPVRRR
jgi:hypothetical protein